MAVQSTSHNQWILRSELIQLSQAEEWSKAVQEWSLDYIEHGGEETCLCSHHPIREICHITNSKTGKTAIVGNVCVKLFAEDTVFKGTHKVFSALNRIKKDETLSANKQLIQYAYDQEILSEGEYEFYLAIWRKRSLSDNQSDYKIALNKRIIKDISKRPEERVNDQKTRLAANLATLKKDPRGWAHIELLDFAQTSQKISDKDYEFYRSIWEQNTELSYKQEKWMMNINQRMTWRVKV